MKRFCFLTSLLVGALVADCHAGVPEDAIALKTSEIEELFSDALDQAEIQDGSHTRASNHWYSDGTFRVSWKNANASGIVTGRWWAENDMRCIIIESGVPDRIGIASCSPLLRWRDGYLSVEVDGKIHAFHKVTPLTE